VLLCVHQVSCALELIEGLRTEANAERGLPRLAVSFALDCRGRFACKPLREWLVRHHDKLVAAAPPVPRACEAILARKAAWAEAQRAYSWEGFVALCRAVDGLASAEAGLLRTAANFLHDAGELVALDHGAAAGLVVLDPTWLGSHVEGELLAPERLHRRPELRKPLLTPAELEVCARSTPPILTPLLPGPLCARQPPVRARRAPAAAPRLASRAGWRGSGWP
jgi:hypothetical protein